MKRYVCVIAVLLLCFSALAGCGEKPYELSQPLKVTNTAPDAAGFAHGYMLLNSDGDLYVYGKNRESGNYSVNWLGVAGAQPEIPIPCTKILSNVAKIDRDTGMAITNSGDLYVWGKSFGNYSLGFDTAEDIETPTLLMSNVADAGYGYAIKENGELWMWGYNTYYNPVTGKGEPTEPRKILDGVVKAKLHLVSVALRENGELWIWNDAESGSAHYLTASISSKPVTKPTKIMDDVADFSIDYGVIAAIKTDGSLWCWGNNEYGQVGDGSLSDGDDATQDCITTAPTKVLDNVKTVMIEPFNTFAITNDDMLYGWGDDGSRILMNDGEKVASPKLLLENVADFWSHDNITVAFALKTDGSLYSWGAFDYGILGNNNSYDWNHYCESYEQIYNTHQIPEPEYCTTPQFVTDNVKRILGGYMMMFVEKNDGSVWYWGQDEYNTVETPAEADLVKWNNGRIWVRCEFFGEFPLPEKLNEPLSDAVCYKWSVIQYPQPCDLPPFADMNEGA